MTFHRCRIIRGNAAYPSMDFTEVGRVKCVRLEWNVFHKLISTLMKSLYLEFLVLPSMAPKPQQ